MKIKPKIEDSLEGFSFAPIKLVPVLIYVCGCLSEPEASLQASMQNDPAFKAYSGLFERIIGRKLGSHEEVKHQQDNVLSVLQNDWLNTSKGEQELENFYSQVVNLLLNSSQYTDEGFLHLHKRRLFLFHQGDDTYLTNSAADYFSLQAEMSAVAKADDYKQLFTYRERYLEAQSSNSSQSLSLIPSCFNYNEQDKKYQLNPSVDCINFLLAKFLPEHHHNAICKLVIEPAPGREADKFSSSYNQRCGKNMAAADRDFCQDVHDGYRKLLGKDYRQIATAADHSVCEDSSSGDEADEEYGEVEEVDSENQAPLTKLQIQVKTNFIPLIYFYVSLVMSQNSKKFITAEQPTAGDYLQVKADRGLYLLKAKLPGALQGIHANPFWLFNHRSTAANMNLHRARLLLYSWFCEYISPDAATKSGSQVNDLGEFEKYFAKEDMHTRSDKNCFDCHKRVQPLANYFGRSSFGVSYSSNEDLFRLSYNQKFLNVENPTTRPAAYYNPNDRKFYPHGKGQGMIALADLLNNHEHVHQCIVKSTWSSIFGANNSLTSKEVRTAVELFTSNNHSYRELLKHLLTSRKAKTYFLKGQQALSDLIAAEQQITCENISEEVGGKTAQDIFIANCSGCHADNLNQSNYKFFDKDGFKSNADEKSYQEAYRRISLADNAADRMPKTAYKSEEGYPDSDIQKNMLLCYLQQQANGKGYSLEQTTDDDTVADAADDAKDKIITPLSNNHNNN